MQANAPSLTFDDAPSAARGSAWARWLRRARRGAGFLLLLTRALWDYGWRVALAGGHGELPAQSAWLSRWSRRALDLLDIRVRSRGQPTAGGLLVANHLSYLDVVVLAAAQPCVFVAKAEVRSWPVLGFMARLAGTLFIDRESRLDVARLNTQIAALLTRGVLVVVFPEGTSTDGRTVLPFHCALLEPAAASGVPVTPAWLSYSLADGSAEQAVCYWGRMVFLPHFLRLLGKETVFARLHFGAPITGAHRKRLGRQLREAVLALASPLPWPDGGCVDEDLNGKLLFRHEAVTADG